MSNSLQPHGLYSPWNSPGQILGVGSLSLLQGIIYLTHRSIDSLPLLSSTLTTTFNNFQVLSSHVPSTTFLLVLLLAVPSHLYTFRLIPTT